MPEYGLCDKSPEQLEEDLFNREVSASFKRAEAAAAEARQRKATAENSTIQTAETLRLMMEQIQKIRDAQDAESQARISAEFKAEKDTNIQKRIDRARFWITLVATLIGSIAAVGSLIATIVLR